MRRRIVAFAVLALLAASCGGGGDEENTGFEDVFAAVSGKRGQERVRSLVAQVGREGRQLSWYTSATSDTADALAEAFGDAYDVDVAVYRAGGETILPRLLEEADAGFHGADVVQINGLAMVNLRQRDLLVPYRSPSIAGLAEDAAYDGWTAYSFPSFVVTWNKKLVRGAERPHAWEDLADERFRGRVALEASDVDWYETLWNYWVKDKGKSPAEAERLFERMARGAGVVHGHSFLAQLMAAGEYAIAPNYTSTTHRFVDEGAPIAWTPIVDPMIVEPNGVGLVEGAPHPAAAVLFVDWLLSDGQKIIDEEGHDAVRKDLVAAPGAERRVIDFANIAAHQQKWTERFERLLRLGKEVESEG